MEAATTAVQVLDACGGKANVIDNAMCMTRLRLVLADTGLVDDGRLKELHGVLGVRSRGANGLEVVFGPAMIDSVAEAFSGLTGLPMGRKAAKAITRMAPSNAPSASAPTPRDTNPGRRASYAAQRKANRTHFAQKTVVEEAPDDLDRLRQMLEGPDALLNVADGTASEPYRAPAPNLLVINGPNINMLGIREPGIYGRETYDDLVALCRREGEKAGFAKTCCFQSNHEGAIVDEVQAALGRFDAIVMNPAAYTHTSVAILDALKAVSIPCVEVHISEVSQREDFRQVSYVRQACIATVTGEGLAGYGHAIRILAEHLAG